MHKETKNPIVIYSAQDGQLSFNVEVLDETVWLTQKQMSVLFDKSVKTISGHIGNIFKEGELDQKVVIRDFRNTTQHGAIIGATQTSTIKIYNLDVIISVGYRVKSQRGTQFRQWATNVLKQHLINGYSVNEVRIKQIESSIEELVVDNRIQTKEIVEIKELLRGLMAKPVIIHNNIKIGSDELESKLIKLLDQIIIEVRKNKQDSTQL